ncbi:hypothetical protein, variant [Aphanomyces astaci]|uniref:Uncharacterized protein n=1 Tax=Aphanomyces astaci TaxID=112090 RepID=W4FGG0_APHAT|nr:hypothetical protein, variant [Aphanomyces astaci]ETV65838.1 hypothetical protein, variant [Aphanomyces astaci]|eukprot:XP_009844701.1 hypothetical protein, variant [Aphanomyces astaci]
MSGGGAPDLLLGIVEARKVHVEDAKKTTSAQDLRDKIAVYEGKHGPAVSIVEKIRQSAPKIAVAAEFKRASPSKGDIAVDADAAEQAMLYAQGGASVISVLTEPARFKGSLDDMLDVALKVETLGRARRPAVLRKDFIFDTYQVLEARAYGADSLLLIVAILTLPELTALLAASRELGMEPLVEVNNEHELDVAIEAGAKLIGVNNRNLRTFKLDLNTTVDIAHAIRRRGIPLEGPESVLLLALSGVFTRADALKFEECGAHGVLVGEMLMRCHNVKDMIQELKGVTTYHHKTLVKTCGITDAATALVAAKHGANLIGIIFVSNSPRNVHLDTAVDIVQVVRKFGERSSRVPIELDELEVPPSSSLDSITGWFQSHAKKLSAASARTPLVVGVFQNQSVEYMNDVAEKVGLDLIQLHGDEGFEVCRQLIVPAIRVVHLPGFHTGGSVNVEAIKENVQAGYAVAILLDTAIKGQMGINASYIYYEVYKYKYNTYLLSIDEINLQIYINMPQGFIFSK